MREKFGRFAISLGGKAYSVDFQTGPQYRAAWQAVLRRHHRLDQAVCMCPGHGARSLVIRRVDKTDQYHLARLSRTGEEHASHCHYYAPAAEKSGLQGYAPGVVVMLQEGGKRIRLKVGLLRPINNASSATPSKQLSPSTRARSQDTMSLLGLLHLLWTDARLAQWHPGMEGKRSAVRVGYWIREQAAQIHASRMTLADVMLSHARAGTAEERRNNVIMQHVIKRKYRTVAVDALARYDETKHAFPLTRIPFSGPFGMPFANIPDSTWALLQHSFARELSAWMSGRKVIAIAQIEPGDTEGRRGVVRDIALMVVSDQWIPVDSSYEVQVEAALREQGRAFYKPVCFDSQEDVVFPDFWLLDVGQDYPMEVFGMATETYLARKAKKTAHYNAKYGAAGWWRWDAAPGAEIPSFPPAR